MCGSSSTTTVKTGDLSERGKSYDSLFNSMLMAQLEAGGFDVNSIEKTEYRDKDKAAQLQGDIADLEEKIANGKSEGLSKSFLELKLDGLKNQLNSLPKDTFQDFDVIKKEDPRILAAIEKYGADAPEVADLREKFKADELQHLDQMDAISKNWAKNMLKLSSGDMSYTKEQEDQVDKFIGPIKNIIQKTTQDLLNTYQESDSLLRKSLDDLSTEIDKTGYAVGDALEAASLQYDKSGATLFGVLKTVNESNYARAKFEFDLLSEKADLQAAQQGAFLGLPPGSQSEKAAAQKMKTDALTSIQLELNAREAAGALSIQQGVEQGKQSISLSKVALAESQGGKKEDVAKNAFGLTQMLTQKNEAVLGNAANAEIALAQKKSDMLYDAAYGGLAARSGAAEGAMSFDLNKKGVQQNQASQLMNPVGQQLGVEQQRQFAETTTTTKQNKGFLDSFTDILGAASSVAGTVMTGMPSGGGGGSSGSSMPQSYAPTPANLDLSLYKNTNAGNFQLTY